MNHARYKPTGLFKKFALLFFLFTASCSLTEKSPNQQQRKAYFASIPITETTRHQIPCVNVKIEERVLPVTLDLGFRGHITMGSKEVSNLRWKTFVSESVMYGVRGKEYKKKGYRIPQLKIGPMTFSFLLLQEDPPEFHKDATFAQNEIESSLEEPGRLGWELFYRTPLLIDVQNGRIAFCDSLQTLKKNGYLAQKFTKAQLFLERGLVEFEASTPAGPLRCVLDTGATWNVFNDESVKGAEEKIWAKENELNYSSFCIGRTDFDPITFRCIPIHIPIHVEAILGIEFFQTHLVFLDLENKAVYFAKNEKSDVTDCI